ncbi:hypothetical protein AgCh_019008 [Apium graveolens]
MNRTKLPIRERIGSVPQLPIGIEVTVAEESRDGALEKQRAPRDGRRVTSGPDNAIPAPSRNFKPDPRPGPFPVEDYISFPVPGPNRERESPRTLIEDEPEKYQTHFSLYAKKGIDADNIDELYKKVHAAIRADPTVKKSEKQQPKEHKRKNKLIERLNALNNVAGADDDEEDDD